jgi:hypothetical protein
MRAVGNRNPRTTWLVSGLIRVLVVVRRHRLLLSLLLDLSSRLMGGDVAGQPSVRFKGFRLLLQGGSQCAENVKVSWAGKLRCQLPRVGGLLTLFASFVQVIVRHSSLSPAGPRAGNMISLQVR